MKMIILSAVAISLLLFSCTDNTKNVAEGMCDCYEKSSVKFSSKTRKLLQKVANSSNPMKTYENELEELDTDEKMQAATEIQEAAGLSDDKKVKACVAKIDKDYPVRGSDEKGALRKVMENMIAKGGDCEAYAGLMNLGFEAQEQSDENEEEETPKKKKKADEEEEEL